MKNYLAAFRISSHVCLPCSPCPLHLAGAGESGAAGQEQAVLTRQGGHHLGPVQQLVGPMAGGRRVGSGRRGQHGQHAPLFFIHIRKQRPTTMRETSTGAVLTPPPDRSASTGRGDYISVREVVTSWGGGHGLSAAILPWNRIRGGVFFSEA